MTQKEYYFYPTFGFVSIFNGYIPFKMHLKMSQVSPTSCDNQLIAHSLSFMMQSACKSRCPSEGWHLSHTFENFVQIFHDFFHYLVERRPCNLNLRLSARKPPAVTACVCNVYAG